MTIEAKAVSKHFTQRSARSSARPTTVAVNEVSFTLAPGKTIGVVGESGSGKSTLARLTLGLLQATNGCIELDGEDIAGLGREGIKRFRRSVQPVFQDPRSALNWKHSIEVIVTEPLVNFRIGSRTQRRQRAVELLDQVRLSPTILKRKAPELSGGMLQRVAIARALALDPTYLICDEPLSALDVSVQAGVINILLELQESKGLAMMFISHDLEIVRHVSDHVLVMYGGDVVEQAPALRLYENPTHPYTRHLLGHEEIPASTDGRQGAD